MYQLLKVHIADTQREPEGNLHRLQVGMRKRWLQKAVRMAPIVVDREICLLQLLLLHLMTAVMRRLSSALGTTSLHCLLVASCAGNPL